MGHVHSIYLGFLIDYYLQKKYQVAKEIENQIKILLIN